MTDPAVIVRSGLNMIDDVEHGALGPHDPSGFGDWIGVLH